MTAEEKKEAEERFIEQMKLDAKRGHEEEVLNFVEGIVSYRTRKKASGKE